MKYVIILIICFNLAGIASSTEKNAAPKKEQSKPVLPSKSIDQDVNTLKSNLNLISDSLQKINLKVKYLSDSIKTTNARIKTIEEKLNGKDESSNSLAISFFIVNLFLLLIIAIVLYIFYARLKNKINHNEHRTITPRSSNTQENKEYNKVQNEFNTIKQEFRQMQYAIDKIQREKKDIAQYEKSLSVSNLPLNVSEPKELRGEEFFMSTPNSDGSFNQSNSSQNFRPTASFYRFVIDNANKTKANFYFVDNEWAVATASDFPQTYIDPVCEAVNAVNNHAKRILTVQPGIVEKSGDKWILIKKATTRYE